MTDEATNAAERGSATTATRGGGEDARKSLEDDSLGSARLGSARLGSARREEG